MSKTGPSTSALTSTSATCVNSNNKYAQDNKCTYCQNQLGAISIKCSECLEFYICLKCFSMSAEIGEHKKDHNYLIRSTICFPLFDSEKLWSYKEELLLLQFIEQYGFGNWDEIAKHLTTKTAQECMEHYHSYLIYGNLGKNTFTSSLKNSALFSQLNGFSNEPSCSANSVGSSSTRNSTDNFEQLLSESKNSKHAINNTTSSTSLSSSPSTSKKVTTTTTTTASDLTTTVLLPPIDMSIEEQRALGYMPLRDDFEREYKNDAETLLSNLTIANNQLQYLNTGLNAGSSQCNNNDADDYIDFQFKIALIQIYRECLNERQRFKKIARDYGLINNASALINSHNKTLNGNLNPINNNSNGHTVTIKNEDNLFSNNNSLLNGNSNSSFAATNANGSGVPITDGRRRGRGRVPDQDKEIIELNERLRKYAQFMSISHYETLLEDLRKQRQLCKRIQELQYYRTQLGLTKIKEIEKYTKEKERLDEHKRQIRREKKEKKLQETPKRLTRGLQQQIELQNKLELKLKLKTSPSLKFNNQNISINGESKSVIDHLISTPNKRIKMEQTLDQDLNISALKNDSRVRRRTSSNRASTNLKIQTKPTTLITSNTNCSRSSSNESSICSNSNQTEATVTSNSNSNTLNIEPTKKLRKRIINLNENNNNNNNNNNSTINSTSGHRSSPSNSSNSYDYSPLVAPLNKNNKRLRNRIKNRFQDSDQDEEEVDDEEDEDDNDNNKDSDSEQYYEQEDEEMLTDDSKNNIEDDSDIFNSKENDENHSNLNKTSEFDEIENSSNNNNNNDNASSHEMSNQEEYDSDNENNDADEDDDADENENDNEEDEDDGGEEEDLSSAGVASSGGSGINELNGKISNDSIISHRLRRHSKTRKSCEKDNNNKRPSIKYMLNESSNNNSSLLPAQNGSIQKSKKINSNENKSCLIINKKRLGTNDNNNNGKSSRSNIKNKLNNTANSLNNSGRRSERLCSMAGYNMLSDNEKKLLH